MGSADNKFKAHKYEYPQAGCTKISLHDPTQLHHISGGERNYYLGCDAVNCCYNVTGAKVPAGSILYGDFEVQHDSDTFRQIFAPPAECLKPNLMQCPQQQVDAWEKQHFKLDYMARQMQQELVV